MPLSTRPLASGVVAAYSCRAKVGYVVPSNGEYLWELILVSEQLVGHPRGRSPTREAALDEIERMLGRWCDAAGIQRGSSAQ